MECCIRGRRKVVGDDAQHSIEMRTVLLSIARLTDV